MMDLIIISGILISAVLLLALSFWLERRPRFKKGDKICLRGTESWEASRNFLILEVGKDKYLVKDDRGLQSSMWQYDAHDDYKKVTK